MKEHLPIAILALGLNLMTASCYMEVDSESDDDELAPNPAEVLLEPDEQDDEPLVRASEAFDSLATVFVPTPFGMEETPYDILNDELVVGDMILGKVEDIGQPGALFSNIGDGGAMGWPGGVIPYEIDISIPPLPVGVPGLYNTIKDAIVEWNAETVVYIRPRIGNEQPYVVIQAQSAGSHLPGCQADLGVGFGGRRNVRLRSNCRKKSIKHEFAHIVGIAHMHQRPDRDAHVIVRDQFVVPGAIADFQKKGSAFGKYDFESRMQYSNYARTAVPRLRVGTTSIGGEMTLHRVPRAGISCLANDNSADCKLGGDSLTIGDTASIVRATDGPSPGSYRLRNVWSQNCLRSSGDHYTPGGNLIPSSCGSTNSRRWYSKTLSGGGEKTLVHRYSRMCLVRTGTNAVLGACDRSSTSEVELVAVGSGNFQLKQGNRCLREINGDIYFSNCNNTPSRRWQLVP